MSEEREIHPRYRVSFTVVLDSIPHTLHTLQKLKVIINDLSIRGETSKCPEWPCAICNRIFPCVAPYSCPCYHIKNGTIKKEHAIQVLTDILTYNKGIK